ncbi:MAG: YoeB-like toxin of bacterial type toxin-antitoxin system [Bacteroidota bacterium]|jgi:toxin YoeB
MITVVSDKFTAHLRDWMLDNKRMAIKIIDLMQAIRKDPKQGIGKPEPPKTRTRRFVVKTY